MRGFYWKELGESKQHNFFRCLDQQTNDGLAICPKFCMLVLHARNRSSIIFWSEIRKLQLTTANDVFYCV
jgi:hypothetical protein